MSYNAIVNAVVELEISAPMSLAWECWPAWRPTFLLRSLQITSFLRSTLVASHRFITRPVDGLPGSAPSSRAAACALRACPTGQLGGLPAGPGVRCEDKPQGALAGGHQHGAGRFPRRTPISQDGLQLTASSTPQQPSCGTAGPLTATWSMLQASLLVSKPPRRSTAELRVNTVWQESWQHHK